MHPIIGINAQPSPATAGFKPGINLPKLIFDLSGNDLSLYQHNWGVNNTFEFEAECIEVLNQNSDQNKVPV